ncbi:MAG: putative quinol monooxygenase [Terracidiphilus sp.]
MHKNDATQVVCIAEFRALDGRTVELVDSLHSLMEPTHREPGCLRYELNQRADDTHWVTFIEKWKDRESFDRHCAMPYIKHFFDEVRPLLVEQYDVKLYEEIVP